VINDLVNRELIRRDFKFLEPVFKDDPEERKASKAGDLDEEDDKFQSVVDETENLNLAKYLREGSDETHLSKPAPEEDVMQPDSKEWMLEYKKVKDKLKEVCKVTDNEHYFSHMKKLSRYFNRVKDIMQQAGNTNLNNYVFICEKALNEIAIHEKKLNEGVPKELVNHKHKRVDNRFE
jgi:hypothetical protein